jgi:hypothetical protein
VTVTARALSHGEGSPSIGCRKIFVGGLSHDTDEGTISTPLRVENVVPRAEFCPALCSAKLKEFFSPHGELADVVVLRDRDTNNSRGSQSAV